MKSIGIVILLLACMLPFLLHQGCAHSAGCTEAPLSPKDLRSAKLLGEILAPPSLSAKKKADLIEAIEPFEHHVGSTMGHTLVHAKFLIGELTLRNLIAAQKGENRTFESNVDGMHAFGPTSNRSFASDGSGTPEKISWWKPDSLENAKIYFWGTHIPKKRPGHVSGFT